VGIITDITAQKKNPNRVSVFIDGEFFCGIDFLSSQKHRLKIGETIDENVLSAAVFDSECNSAFEKCMGLINIRMRAESEIITYLAGKLYSQEVIDTIINKLKSYNYIDDAEFCCLYIESHRKGWGRKKIEYMLKMLKIDSEILSESMKVLASQADEAHCLLIKHKGTKPFDKYKAYVHLAQKGFNGDCIKEAIALMEEETANE